MIQPQEIEEKARDFGVHEANVQRDYVFGWLLAGIYGHTDLAEPLILKGGNALRKGYFGNTRYSKDLDFSCESDIEAGFLAAELKRASKFAEKATGVQFDLEKQRVEEKFRAEQRKVWEARIYFQDFYSGADHITIMVHMDVTRFDKIFLPVQERELIHPFSDVDDCRATIRCHQLEEILASKLKCLLQRRHSPDLYDFVYSIFFNHGEKLNRNEIVSTLLKKTIFEPSPGTLRGILMDLPLETLRGFWNKHIACPSDTRIGFDQAAETFLNGIEDMFKPYAHNTGGELAYFPSAIRNVLLDAAHSRTLVRMTYNGITRLVEPYSLLYKEPQGRSPREYFFGYDQTGGENSGPGLKSFIHENIEKVENTTKKFIPQVPIEMAKAGEPTEDKTFAGGGGRPRSAKTLYGGSPRLVYIRQCAVCGRQFPASRSSGRLRKHNNSWGSPCTGRSAIQVRQEYQY